MKHKGFRMVVMDKQKFWQQMSTSFTDWSKVNCARRPASLKTESSDLSLKVQYESRAAEVSHSFKVVSFAPETNSLPSCMEQTHVTAWL
jgi:hypothetical protein